MIEQYSTGRIIRMSEVVDKVGYAKSTIHASVKIGQFPAPFKLTPNGRAIGWFENTIDQWLQERVSQSNPEAENLKKAAQ